MTVWKYNQKYTWRLERVLYRLFKWLFWIRQDISCKRLLEIFKIKSLKEIVDEIQNRNEEVVKEKNELRIFHWK